MKKLIFVVVFMMLVIITGCGGGTGGVGDLSGEPSVVGESPGGGGDGGGLEGSEGGDGDAAGNTENQNVVTDNRLLISGNLIDEEGAPIPDTKITFHSDPVEVITDSLGYFETLLEEGTHTVEIASETIGYYVGTIEVFASGVINELGWRIGIFTDEMMEEGSGSICKAARLVDLGMNSAGVNFGISAIVGATGHDVNAQGSNRTALIIGNSRMTANMDFDGRISGLYFPTVGSYNHVPYLSDVATWVDRFQGAFGGIKRGDSYYWFTDRNYWNVPTIAYPNITNVKAPIANIEYVGVGTCSGTTVTQKAYIVYDPSNQYPQYLLMMDFTISGNACASSFAGAEFAFYSRFNPNNTNQIFKQWKPAKNLRTCVNNRLFWTPDPEEDSPYTLTLEAMTSTGAKISMSNCTAGILSLDDARRVVSDTDCYPGGVIGSISEWGIPGNNKRVVIAIAGDTVNGDSGVSMLNRAESLTPTSLETRTKNSWSAWMTGLSAVNANWKNRFDRWLVTMKMLADDDTRAIIASPSLEPTFYYSWPRDGVFQSTAYLLAGKPDVAEKFYQFLFDTAEKQNGTWVQAYSSLDGSKLGLPDYFNVNIEQDQPPTVLWGLWVYWNKMHSLPDGVSNQDIKDVAEYVVSQICDNGLIIPSIDWHENPLKDIGQSLYTNAAAHAGLLAAAEMIEGSDANAASRYRAAAIKIRHGVEDRLCDATSCHMRIFFNAANTFALVNKTAACGLCSPIVPAYSDAPGENIMAFAWPFHLFPLGDPRVVKAYNDVYATHGSLSLATPESPLWIPRILFSHLYALAAVSSGEVTDASFISTLNSHISEVESNFDALTTDYGYLMDQYIGDEGGVKRGTASRPLGWAQAMGIYVALAKSNIPVPLITEPETPTPQCTQGVCCDSNGNYKSASVSCSSSTLYSCPNGTSCGADVMSQTVTQYCSGSSAACDGSTIYGTLTLADNCTASERCVAGNSVCQPCTCVCSAADGPCCDGCNYKSSGTACATETQYQCAGTACGDNVQERTRARTCSGSSSACGTTFGAWSSWTTHESCSNDEKCNATTFVCESSAQCPTTDCTPNSGPCCDSSGNFRSSSYVCNSNAATSTECHWGTSCGSDVGYGVQKQYCSGSSSACNGSTSWTWNVQTDCLSTQKCSNTDDQCHSDATCCSAINWSANLHAQSTDLGAQLTWSAASGADGYAITRSSTGTTCPPTSNIVWGGGVTFYLDTDLDPGECQVYGVYAINSCDQYGGCGGMVLGCRSQ